MNDRIIEGSENMDLTEIMRLLKMTYWADQRSVEQVSKSGANTAGSGVYVDHENKVSAYAGAVDVYATTCYLCEVLNDRVMVKGLNC